MHAARLPLSADLFKYKIRKEIREFFGDGARRQCPAINSICSSGGGLTRIVERKRVLARIDFFLIDDDRCLQSRYARMIDERVSPQIVRERHKRYHHPPES